MKNSAIYLLNLNQVYQTTGYEAMLAIPQVFPIANLIYPVSPQLVPQEFLTIQASLVNPTAKTP